MADYAGQVGLRISGLGRVYHVFPRPIFGRPRGQAHAGGVTLPTVVVCFDYIYNAELRILLAFGAEPMAGDTIFKIAFYIAGTMDHLRCLPVRECCQ